MYKKYTLSNGLTVVTEHIPFVKSISIGVWIETGSKNENQYNNGISHFIEHMLFKGTKTKSAKKIAEMIDGVGGQINAFTSKECTCFYTKVLDSHFDLAIELLSDMIFNSVFDPQEIEKERSVILEEINMYEDSPEDLVHDLFSQTIFKDHSLGLPILGTEKNLQNIDQQLMKNYMRERYVADNAVISIAGNFDENKLLKTLENNFQSWPSSQCLKRSNEPIQYNFQTASKVKDIEQTHLCIGFQGVPLESRELYPLLIVNNVLGGSMSSRLFQKVREEKGLAYSVYSYPSIYKDGGLLVIYAGMNPNQLNEVTKIIYNELQDLLKFGLTKNEIEKSKEQLKGNYILGLESTSSRMTSIGKSQLLLKKIYSPKEIIEKIDNISEKDIEKVIGQIIDINRMTITTVGKEDQMEGIKKIFNL